ncbi:MAG TPA: hypothetical protein VF055_10030 [Steroidobacteraceae bacterium]|jgi:hypothetical protein
MAGYTGTRSSRLRFHAVTVLPGADACPQAQSLLGVRVLSAEAPRLPIGGCDRPDRCDCRFKHHDDRRAGQRRRVDRSPPLTERRSVQGRRATDWTEG